MDLTTIRSTIDWIRRGHVEKTKELNGSLHPFSIVLQSYPPKCRCQSQLASSTTGANINILDFTIHDQTLETSNTQTTRIFPLPAGYTITVDNSKAGIEATVPFLGSVNTDHIWKKENNKTNNHGEDTIKNVQPFKV